MVEAKNVYIVVQSLDDFIQRLQAGNLRNCVVQGINVSLMCINWETVDTENAFFLGCTFAGIDEAALKILDFIRSDEEEELEANVAHAAVAPILRRHARTVRRPYRAGGCAWRAHRAAARRRHHPYRHRGREDRRGTV